jgi:hypothetical protein
MTTPETKKIAANYMQWVGGSYYSIDSYVKEAKKMGASRRINYVPKNVIKGVSKVFLISDMPTEEQRDKYKQEYNRRLREAYVPKKDQDSKKKYNSIKKPEPMPRGEPVIFGYFTINSIVYITEAGMNVPEELKKLGVDTYEYQPGNFGFNDERGCGSLKVGGTYFLSEESMEKVKELASSTELESKSVHIFKTPIPAKDIKRFRGIKEIPTPKSMELETTVAKESATNVS